MQLIQFNRKDGSRIMISVDKIVSIVEEEDGSAVVRMDNGSFQVLKQSYGDVIKMFKLGGAPDEL